jgi:hypothetical protein
MGWIHIINLYGFSVACEGEDKFAVAREGKLTFLAEASPKPKMNFSKRSAEKLPLKAMEKLSKINIFGGDIVEVKNVNFLFQ